MEPFSWTSPVPRFGIWLTGNFPTPAKQKKPEPSFAGSHFSPFFTILKCKLGMKVCSRMRTVGVWNISWAVACWMDTYTGWSLGEFWPFVNFISVFCSVSLGTVWVSASLCLFYCFITCKYTYQRVKGKVDRCDNLCKYFGLSLGVGSCLYFEYHLWLSFIRFCIHQYLYLSVLNIVSILHLCAKSKNLSRLQLEALVDY